MILLLPSIPLTSSALKFFWLDRWMGSILGAGAVRCCLIELFVIELTMSGLLRRSSPTWLDLLHHRDRSLRHPFMISLRLNAFSCNWCQKDVIFMSFYVIFRKVSFSWHKNDTSFWIFTIECHWVVLFDVRKVSFSWHKNDVIRLLFVVRKLSFSWHRNDTSFWIYKIEYHWVVLFGVRKVSFSWHKNDMSVFGFTKLNVIELFLLVSERCHFHDIKMTRQFLDFQN